MLIKMTSIKRVAASIAAITDKIMKLLVPSGLNTLVTSANHAVNFFEPFPYAFMRGLAGNRRFLERKTAATGQANDGADNQRRVQPSDHDPFSRRLLPPWRPVP